MANSQPLVLRFASDVEPALRSMAILRSGVVGNLALISAAALGTARAVNQSGDSFTQNWRTHSLTFARLVGGMVAQHLALKAAIAAGTAAIIAGLAAAAVEFARFEQIVIGARRSNVSTDFFQAFTRGADNVRVSMRTLQDALSTASGNLVDRFEQPAAVLARLREFYLAGFDVPQNAQGLRQFEAAQNTEQRIRAVLVAARELEGIGQRLAALDILESVFGRGFADEVRRGSIELGTFLDRLESPRVPIVSREQLDDLAELNRRFQEAGREIREGLEPITRDLGSAMQEAYRWTVAVTEVLGGLARATGDVYTNVRRLFTEIRQAPAPQLLADQQLTAIRQRLRDTGLSPLQRSGLEEQLARAEAAAARARVDTGPPAVTPPDVAPRSVREPNDRNQRADLPVPDPAGNPRRGPDGRFHEPPADATPSRARAAREETDAVQKAIESLERENRVLQAQVDTFGRSNAERERAVRLARIDSSEATPEQIASINRLVDAQVRLRDQLRDNEAAQRNMNQALQEAGDLIVDFVTGSTNAEKALKRFATEWLRASLTGQGPLSGLLGLQAREPGQTGGFLGALAGNALRPAGGGGILGLLGGLFGGFRADGGPVAPGMAYMVGERGREVFVPEVPGRIIASGALGRGGNVTTISMPLNVDARGATRDSVPLIAAAAEAAANRAVAQLVPRIPGIVRQANERSG